MNLKEKILSSGLFIDNDYLESYLLLVNDNLTNSKSELTQKHHIFPRSYSKYLEVEVDNSKDNLVNLDFKDHCLVHYYLIKCTNIEQLQLKNKYALWRMLGDKIKLEDIVNTSKDEYNKIYSEIVEYNRQIHLGTTHFISEETKEKIRLSNMRNNRGKIYIFKDDEELRIYPEEFERYKLLGYEHGRSNKTKQSLSNNYNYESKGMLGKNQSEYQKKRVSEALTGIIRSSETKSKQSESRKNAKYVMLVNPQTHRVIQVKECNIQKYLDKGFWVKD